MSFLYPLGLLGLIGVPILILIYIIKSKYAEQTVASTYLWTLSERFLKRKRPINPLTGIISLILQILAVITLSLIIAHPIITVPASANEYCLILDASGSMQMREGETTRFDLAKEKAAEIIEGSTDGSIYTLITVSDVTTTVFEKTSDKKQALELLDELEGGFVSPEYTDALGTAQAYFNENSGVLTYLVTDTVYQTHDNIEIINVSRDAKNVGVSDVTWEIVSGTLTVRGKIDSYSEERELTVSAYADGASDPIATQTLVAKPNESAPFTLSAPMKTFSSLRIALNASDDLSYDDEYVIYDTKSEETYSILIVSETPFFLETVLSSVGHTKLTVMKPEEYSSSVKGYGLYIFESCTPTELPGDGAVWFFDPQGSVPNSGFSVQGDVTLARAEDMEMTESTSTQARKLTEGLSGKGIYTVEYVKCSLYRNFTTLFSYKGNPLVFAGTNNSGHREVVFAFDLHNSNLPMLVDFVVMIDNLMRFSFPDVIEEVNYDAGEDATVNVIANCESIRVESPSGSVTYLDTGMASATFPVSEVGTYTVTVTVSDIPSSFYVYSSLPKEERVPAPAADAIGLQGEATEGGFDGTFDPMTLLFICLGVLFLADWMVYCYEKYQLR